MEAALSRLCPVVMLDLWTLDNALPRAMDKLEGRT
jgi:hypothetical protein